jgi:SAM-dependent methyltransferase
MSVAALDEAIAVLSLPAGARMVEIGCGDAAILRRIAAASRAGWALGIDLDAELIERGRAEAERLGVDVELRTGDARELSERGFDLAVCVASSHALGGFPRALAALRELVRPGGQVLLGEGYWRSAPSGAYLEALGAASAEELPDRAGLIAAAEAAGLVPLHSVDASQADWDRYEWGLIRNAERWGAEHAGEPDADTLSERARAARARLAMPGGRETLGFALLLLERR